MKTLLIVLALMSFLIMGTLSPVSAEYAAKSVSPDLITYYNKNKLQGYSPSTKQKVDLNIPGVLSHDRKLTAYTKESGTPASTEPYIYIRDITSATETKIPVQISGNFNILQWSPNDKYILLKEQAGYVGGLKGDIYSFPAGKFISQISLLSEKVNWPTDSTLYYFAPDNTCIAGSKDSCNPTAVLSKVNISSAKSESLYNLPATNLNQFPEITDLDKQGDKLGFSYKHTDTDESSAQYDLTTKKVGTVANSKLMGYKALTALKISGWKADRVTTQDSTANGDLVLTLRSSNDENKQAVAVYHSQNQIFEIISSN